jgi:hypothetical protein
MNNRFWFNEETYDFWPIYETIKKFYPLAGDHGDEDDYRDESPETLLRGNTIYESVYSRSHYSAKWKEFKKYLQKEVSKKIETSHFLSFPCFEGRLVLEQKACKDVKWTKELHFSICLLGPYYTIIGLDKTQIKLERERIFSENQEPKWQNFSRAQAITVSPVFEYKEAFLLLQQKISSWFEGYKFVPYRINMMKVDGLFSEVNSANESLKGTVFSALFNSTVEIDARVRGDEAYGYQEWRKVVEPTEEEHRNLNQLEASKLKSRAQVGLAETSLHKLWKYKELIRLSPVSGALISIPTFCLLDFSDPEVLLLTEEGNDLPQSSKYELVGSEIKLTSVTHFWFKVSMLSERELKLIFHLDFGAGEKRIKGDIAELVFELY